MIISYYVFEETGNLREEVEFNPDPFLVMSDYFKGDEIKQAFEYSLGFPY